jgi:site-specific DNA-cytosine methylase
VRVLVACEFSGVVREAFRKRGHDAWSCDLLPAEDGSEFHILGDCREVPMNWDMMIAHPPCTHLAVSGARWFKNKHREQAEAIRFVKTLANAAVPMIAIENPIGVLSTFWRKPDQIIQPWMFGHGETKATCLWLKGLPKLTATNIVSGRHGRVWREAPSLDRWKNRSRTLQGIADAMAEQWGGPCPLTRVGRPGNASTRGTRNEIRNSDSSYPVVRLRRASLPATSSRPTANVQHGRLEPDRAL